MGGTIEESAKGDNSIIAVMPMMLIVVLTLLMIQGRTDFRHHSHVAVRARAVRCLVSRRETRLNSNDANG